ncbi:MAG: glycosyltransferase family 4 protein [Bradyrhizobiaceae bacterium]|nr:glycosyltransferase family 4 protein [Hyphomicrobiales bacterium]MBV9426537.1 glycosyltransferase family 4 protein [Bradyrhizobiaceae bacterium]
MSTTALRPLAILHVFRAPVGGLFRHVIDLVRGQTAAGHRVGIIADAVTGGARAEAALAEIAPLLALGLTRVPMSRHLGLSDVAAMRRVAQVIQTSDADVVHGHGAKGGAYARLAGARALRAYTPHGGSLHFDPRTPIGFVYLTLERALLRRTDLILFESAYAREVYHARIGTPAARVQVIHNGVAAAEFAPVTPATEASDVVFVGELRRLKGVDVLIQALSLLGAQGRPVSATIVGSGPEAAEFQALARARGVPATFPGALPARDAFARGRLLVVPSRAESLPYIVLEAAAAGIPMLATKVGGIPEIFGPDREKLLPAGDAASLAAAIRSALADPTAAYASAQALRERVRTEFNAATMVDGVLAAYRAAIEQAAVR